MRRPTLVLGLIAGLLSTVAVPATASAAPDRQAPCAQAWTLIAQQRAGMDQNDLSAWAAVNDGFLSLADGTTDGDLSNALGVVSAAAEVITLVLQSEDASDPSRVDFNTALGALGTACAQLSVKPHRLTVARFQKFAYQTGVVTGLDSTAAASANSALGKVVDRATRTARRAGSAACTGGATRCAYFVQTLKQSPCIDGVVCLRSQLGLLPAGANDSEATVTTLALDSVTGRPVPLSRVVSEGEMESFLVSVNTAILEQLKKGGLGNDAYWTPDVTAADITAWLPQPDGMHLWFDKYAVAPGNFGIVHVVVPWP